MLFVCYEKEQTNALYIWNKSGNRVLKYVVTKYLFLDYRNFGSNSEKELWNISFLIRYLAQGLVTTVSQFLAAFYF